MSDRARTPRPQFAGAEEWVPARVTAASLRAGVESCRGCDLWEGATHGVPGNGPVDASLMLLGEQPGDQEDLAGEPFVGPAGQLLDRALADAGLDPAHVYRTNAVHHFRWSGTRGKQRIHKSPSTWHVAACGPWMVAELDLVQPAGLVVLGATAGRAMYGSSFKVGETRGQRLDFPEQLPGGRSPGHRPRWVLPTTHPSAVLRSRDRDRDYAAFVADLRVAAELLA
jgi:uracil-DNA glycosylase family protein